MDLTCVEIPKAMRKDTEEKIMRVKNPNIIFTVFAFIPLLFLPLGCGGSRTEIATPRIDLAGGEAAEVWVATNGSVLPIYDLDGKYYLLGEKGIPYEICVKNLIDVRIEAVLSVDGRDVVKGEKADYRENRGYIISPNDHICVAGFRTSLDRVASFEFSSKKESYAARRGDASNVGVIGLAVFTEGPSHGSYTPLPDTPHPHPLADGEGGDQYEDQAAESAAVDSESSMRKRSKKGGIGTKYGRSVRSGAEIVPFERQNPDNPEEIIALYYDDEDGLEEAGVVFSDDDEPGPCDGPNPFPGVEGRPDCRYDFTPPPNR